jgi:hypothetical protein
MSDIKIRNIIDKKRNFFIIFPPLITIYITIKNGFLLVKKVIFFRNFYVIKNISFFLTFRRLYCIILDACIDSTYTI